MLHRPAGILFGLLILLLLGGPGARVAAAAPLSLPECISLAQGQAAQVVLGERQQEVDRTRLDAARRRFFPKVDLDLLHQPKVDYFGRPLEDKDVFATEMKLTQPIYHSGAITSRYRAARQGLVRSRLERRRAALEAGLAVVPLYFKVLASRDLLRLHRSLVAKAQRLVDLARQGVQLGGLRREELLKAQAKLFEVKYDLARVRSRMLSSGFELKALLGLERHRALDLKPQQPAFRPPPEEVFLRRALEKNPLVQFYRAEELYRRLALEAARDQDGPQVDLVGRYGFEGDDFPGEEKYYGLMVQLKMRLGDNSATAFYDHEHQFENPTALYYRERDLRRKGLRFSFLDGGSQQSELAQALLERHRARLELRDQRRKLATRVHSLYQELRRNDSLYHLAQGQVSLERERLETTRTRYQNGAATPAEVLERELDLAQAQARLIQARRDRSRVLTLLCLLGGGSLVMEDEP